MMQRILSTISPFMVIVWVFIAACFGTKPVYSQYYSQSSNAPTIVVDKKIRSVNDPTFYDNITSERKVFSEGDQIEFQIKVENRGTVVLQNIKLQDILPKYLSLLFYPGVFNKTTNIIETNIDKLDPGQSKEFLIRAKISDLPSTTGVSGGKMQLVNKAVATTNNASDSDEARYFVAKSISIPSTGAGDLGLKTGLALMITVSAVGIRKLARGY